MAPLSLYSEQTRAYHRYLGWLEEITRLQTIAGLVPDDQPLLLQQIYVPLKLSSEPLREDAEDPVITTSTLSLADLLVQHADDPPREAVDPWLLCVSGPAGSGKTTLTHSVALGLTGLVRDDLYARFEQHIPVPILLRNVPKEHLRSLDAMVDWWLAQVSREGFVADDLRYFLDEGLAIIILDGLDELGSVEARRQVVDALHGHRWVTMKERVPRLAGRPCLVMVTGRPSAFEGLTLPKGSKKAHVAPFSMTQVRSFLQRWFELRPISEKLRQDSVERFMQRLGGETRLKALRTLARRPAYLTALAYVHGTRGALPHSRVQLYEMIVDAYIDHLDRLNRVRMEALNWDRVDKRSILAAIAWSAHSGQWREDSAKAGERSFSFTRGELVVLTTRLIGELTPRSIELGAASELVHFYLAGTGLFSETREGAWEFGHLSFQEYLAALHVVELATAEGDKVGIFRREIFERLGLPGWLEVAAQAMAIDALRSGGRGHSVLLASLSPDKAGHLGLIGYLLGGAEIPLRPEERGCWLWLWIVQGAVSKDFPCMMDVVAFEPNREALLSLGNLVLEGWTRAGWSLESVRTGLTEQIKAVAPRALNQWSILEGALDMQGEARLLIPLATSPWSDALHVTLNAYLRATRWQSSQPFLAADMREGCLSWLVCESLVQTTASRALFSLFSPLPWVLSRGDATTLAWVYVEPPETSPRRRWLGLLDLCSMVACARVMAMVASEDVVFWSHIEATLVTRQAPPRNLTMTLVRALGLSWDWGWEWDRDRVWNRDRDRNRDRTRTMAQALAIARTREQERGQDRQRDRTMAMTMTLILDGTEWSQIFSRADQLLDPAFDDSIRVVVQLIEAASLSELNSSLFPSIFTRADLSALRSRMLSGDVLDGVTDAEERSSLLREWQDILSSDHSPIPLVNDLLKSDWDSVNLTAEGFLRQVEALLKGRTPPTSDPTPTSFD